MNKIVGKQDYRKAVKRYMIECNIEGHLVVECETRWGTVFRLVQKFFDLIPALFRFASSTTCPSGMGSKIRSVIKQLPVLKALIFAWEPVQRFETTIQADRHPTAGMSYPFAYSMVQRLGNNFERIVPPLPAIVQKVTDDAQPALRLYRFKDEVKLFMVQQCFIASSTVTIKPELDMSALRLKLQTMLVRSGAHITHAHTHTHALTHTLSFSGGRPYATSP